MISSPGLNNFNTPSIAAKPEPNAKPAIPPSIDANAFSKAVLVGFAPREYSYPL